VCYRKWRLGEEDGLERVGGQDAKKQCDFLLTGVGWGWGLGGRGWEGEGEMEAGFVMMMRALWVV
jgi:hypothetical protein